jgi:predicted dinucleotide-binding enzyme
LAGKIVIDANNYYPERDGDITKLSSKQTTSSELLAAHLPASKVVKAFNAIISLDLEKDGRPAGHVNRRALPLAGDDAAAKKVVADLHDEFGYDPVDVGRLAEGWRFQPGTPVYCISFNSEWMKKALTAATR